MALINCKKCKRLFLSDQGQSLCSRCNEDIDDEFNIVREYIYDYPESSLKSISDGTGVSPDAILKWIREGKIVISESQLTFCEKCNEPTNKARFCPRCAEQLKSKISMDNNKADSDKKHIGMYIK